MTARERVDWRRDYHDCPQCVAEYEAERAKTDLKRYRAIVCYGCGSTKGHTGVGAGGMMGPTDAGGTYEINYCAKCGYNRQIEDIIADHDRRHGQLALF